MWEDSRYFCVVLCKNYWFHVPKNLFFRHRILLAETDAIASRPAIDTRFRVGAISAAKSISIRPRKCSDANNKRFLSRSLPIRYSLRAPLKNEPAPRVRPACRAAKRIACFRSSVMEPPQFRITEA
jgi:hypothetical protein